MLHPLPLPLSSCLGCIPPLIGLPSLRFYAVGSSLFLLSVCFCLCSLFYRDDVLCWLLLARPFLYAFHAHLRFPVDLVWFRLSCDHGWIRSGSVNVRKQQQQQQQHAKNPVFEIVHEESVKVYHLHMYNGNIQQNSMRRILCHSGISHLSSVLACVFSSQCNVLHVICEHHALGAVLLSSMRLVRSAMGEYLVLALGTAGYRLGPLRKGTHGTFLIGQSAPFFIHPSPN